MLFLYTQIFVVCLEVTWKVENIFFCWSIYQVQNADDNTYPEDVEPTLAFILQENGIAVLNNERGFSAENISALCDIGNSTKKGSNQGYIGNKGIGFKSVFRVGINTIVTFKLLYIVHGFIDSLLYCLL